MWRIFKEEKTLKQIFLKAQQLLVISIFCDSDYASNWLIVPNSNATQAFKAKIYQKMDY